MVSNQEIQQSRASPPCQTAVSQISTLCQIGIQNVRMEWHGFIRAPPPLSASFWGIKKQPNAALRQ